MVVTIGIGRGSRRRQSIGNTMNQRPQFPSLAVVCKTHSLVWVFKISKHHLQSAKICQGGKFQLIDCRIEGGIDARSSIVDPFPGIHIRDHQDYLRMGNQSRIYCSRIRTMKVWYDVVV